MAPRDRMDMVRSLVRSAARRAKDAVLERDLVGRVKTAASDLVNQRTRVPEQELSRVFAYAPGVASATATARDGVLAVHVTFDDGEFIAAELTPSRLAFAPRGAKEVEFAIQLAPGSAAARLTEVVGALGEHIAAVVWGLGAARLGRRSAPPPGPSAIHVDRVDGRVRVDLRTSRAARQFRGTPLEPMLDVFELRALRATGEALELDLGLPGRR